MECVAVRRAQVRYAMTRRLSCRRACALRRVARSALGDAAERPRRDAVRVAELQRLAAAHPRYGYRRMWALLRRRGLTVNAKRVHRVWRRAGLALPRWRARRKLRTGARVRPRADRPNAVWTYDLVHDACADGTRFKCLTVVDEFTKECLSITVARSQPAERVLPVVAQLVDRRGAPQYLRSDNGPEFIAHRIRRWLGRTGLTTASIDPGKPWQNGVGESLHSRFRDECLNQEAFFTVSEAAIFIEQYRRAYNQARPHSRLHYQTPAEVATRRARPPRERSLPHGQQTPVAVA
jgi:putative transposase